MRKLLSFLAIFFLLAALVVSLARSFTPLLTQHKAWFCEKVSRLVGLPVEMDSLEFSFVGFTPGIVMHHLVIFSENKQNKILEVAQAQIGINILKSLWKQQLMSELIRVDGVSLSINQDHQGQFFINHYLVNPVSAHPQNLQGFWKDGWIAPDNLPIFNWIFSQKKIRLSHISLTNYRDNQKLWEIPNLQFSLVNRGSHHHLRAILQVGGNVATRRSGFLHLVSPNKSVALLVDANYKGEIADRKNLQGRVYVQFSNEAIYQLGLKSFLDRAQIKRLEGGDTKLWAQFSKGELSDVTVALNLQQFEWMQPHHAQVAFDALQGVLVARQEKDQHWVLQSDLQGQAVELNFLPIFGHPLSLKTMTLQGALAWQPTQQGSELTAKDFYLSTPLIKTLINFHLNLPNNHVTKLAQMDLIASFEQPDTSQIKNILPRPLMNAELVEWLNSALLAGAGEKGLVVMRGKLGDFPYAHHEGQFIAEADIADMDLQYARDWPPIHKLNGLLRFDLSGMVFKAGSGMLLQQPVTKLTARIPELFRPEKMILRAESSFQIPAGDALSFTQNSPLKEKLSGLKQLQGAGNMKVDLGLSIPLQEKDFSRIRVDGQIGFLDSTLQLPAWDLILNQVTGTLNFSEKGVWAKGLQAVLFDQPAQMDIETVAEKNDSMTRFHIQHSVNMTTLQKRFDLPILKSLAGQAAYSAILDIPEKSPTRISNLSSNLQGVSVDLPAPYGKRANAARPFNLQLSFPENAMLLSFDYDHLLQAILGFESTTQGMQLSRGSMQLQSTPSDATSVTVPLILPEQTGLLVKGQVGELDWETWHSVIQKYFMAPSNTTKSKVSYRINLATQAVKAFQQRIENANVTVSSLPTAVKVGIESSTISGELIVPDNFPAQPLQGNFKQLMLQLQKSSAKNASTKGVGNLKPMDLPPMDMRIADLQINEMPIGNLQFQVSPVKGQAVKVTGSLKNDFIQSNFNGLWRMRKVGQEYTRLEAQNSISDMGGFLKAWGLTEKMLGASGEIDFNLSWPHSPMNFNFEDLTGQASLNLKHGTIVGFDDNTKTKMDIAKVLNGLSIQSVYQRVSSGFSDVRHGGYGFTSFKGTYQFTPGHIETGDTAMDGSIGKISFVGSIHTREKTYDLSMKVIPQYTSSAPVVIGFIVNPLVGVAALAANQVVSMGLDKVTGTNYTVTGSWQDPQVVAEKK